jgi:hypothetical protein
MSSLSRRGGLLVAIVSALASPACAAVVPRPAAAPWRPLRRQPYDAATTYLFNAAVARTQTPGNGGLMMGNAPAGDLPWRADSKVVPVPGRYRLGVQSRSSSYGYLWMPGTGILSPRDFTIEFWVKSDVPFRVAGGTPVDVEGISFGIGDGQLTASFSNAETYPPVTAAVNVSVASLPAHRWEEFALTYARQRLTLYMNGRAAASKSGVRAPQVWSDISRSDGLTVGGAAGRGATELSVSDLRISRVARVPGKAEAPPHTLSVTSNSTGVRVRQSLLGGLHTLTTRNTERMARGTLRVIRTDKLISSTPIKLGGPDVTHPSQGVSGVYSYDWEVVDRTLRYFRRIGVEPYLSIDATPQVLGGADAPLSGHQLHTARSLVAGFAAQVPDDLHAWRLVVQDLTFHIIKQDHMRVAYWSVWNEPDGSEFWSGTLDQYLALYQATVDGVRSVDRHAVVGGAETAGWDTLWTGALISFCASRGVPLNFVSWHYYSGDLGEIPEARATVAALAARYRIRRPTLNIGEWAWQTANLPKAGLLPFAHENYFLNDWSAAFVGASLIDMQRSGVIASVYTNPVASRGASGFAGSGLMSPTGPWANLNVFRLWHMLPAQMVRSSLDADPGVFAVGAKNRHRLAVLIDSFHYQLGGRFPLALQLPRRLARRGVRVWVIDRHHADAYDAGPHHAQLSAISERLSAHAQLHLTLPARAVMLVDVPLH